MCDEDFFIHIIFNFFFWVVLNPIFSPKYGDFLPPQQTHPLPLQISPKFCHQGAFGLFRDLLCSFTLCTRYILEVPHILQGHSGLSPGFFFPEFPFLGFLSETGPFR